MASETDNDVTLISSGSSSVSCGDGICDNGSLYSSGGDVVSVDSVNSSHVSYLDTDVDNDECDMCRNAQSHNCNSCNRNLCDNCIFQYCDNSIATLLCWLCVIIRGASDRTTREGVRVRPGCGDCEERLVIADNEDELHVPYVLCVICAGPFCAKCVVCADEEVTPNGESCPVCSSCNEQYRKRRRCNDRCGGGADVFVARCYWCNQIAEAKCRHCDRWMCRRVHRARRTGTDFDSQCVKCFYETHMQLANIDELLPEIDT